MSDRISHECGLAVVRLLKPLDWYREHHGDSLWGLRRLFLLMEKQHNRGQDGAGIGAVRFDMPAGEQYLARLRSAERFSPRSSARTRDGGNPAVVAFRCPR